MAFAPAIILDGIDGRKGSRAIRSDEVGRQAREWDRASRNRYQCPGDDSVPTAIALATQDSSDLDHAHERVATSGIADRRVGIGEQA